MTLADNGSLWLFEHRIASSNPFYLNSFLVSLRPSSAYGAPYDHQTLSVDVPQLRPSRPFGRLIFSFSTFESPLFSAFFRLPFPLSLFRQFSSPRVYKLSTNMRGFWSSSLFSPAFPLSLSPPFPPILLFLADRLSVAGNSFGPTSFLAEDGPVHSLPVDSLPVNPWWLFLSRYR